MKRTSISSLKKKAWKVFSEYIRQKYADWRGYATCVTCGAVKHWKELQAGHFIGGRRNSLLFDERACHPQCMPCNVWKHGDQIKYFRFMQRAYGEHVIRELESLNLVDKQFKKEELESIIKKYKPCP